jgi:hypothetical protein
MKRKLFNRTDGRHEREEKSGTLLLKSVPYAVFVHGRAYASKGYSFAVPPN